jgi:hypothetical protein
MVEDGHQTGHERCSWYCNTQPAAARSVILIAPLHRDLPVEHTPLRQSAGAQLEKISVLISTAGGKRHPGRAEDYLRRRLTGKSVKKRRACWINRKSNDLSGHPELSYSILILGISH